MKKLLTIALVGAAVAGVALIVRRAAQDMRESEELWAQITDEVDAQIAEAEAAAAAKVEEAAEAVSE
ncbi:DLW-39 family protein [Scrofimicrobium canadense]|uniref:DLW-39 family protein n=1 Tax=Scrofimicrobium canadense TaxID=2652290 RepID=UPI00197D0F24|nr:DLW-39 family protein [Scrofimicrobium canadense]